MELYFFPHIESVRILPFTKKKKISVPASQIEKYIDNIVIPIARYHEITTQGLNIIEETYACEAVLSLEDTIYDEQMLTYRTLSSWRTHCYFFTLSLLRLLACPRQKTGCRPYHDVSV